VNTLINEIIDKCKKKYNENPLYHDIGDIIPFINFYEAGKDFSRKQIEQTVDKINDIWLYKRNENFIFLSDQIDLILGFIEYYRQTKESRILRYFEKIMKSISTYFIINNKIYGVYDLRKKSVNKNVSYYGAVIIEYFVDLYEFTLDEKALAIATKLSLQIVSNKYFKKYGLLGDYNNFKYLIRNFRTNIWNKQVSKSTNFIIGIIAVYEKYNNEILYESLDNYFNLLNKDLMKDGLFLSGNNLKNGKIVKTNLFTSFEAIDMLCYMFFVTKNIKFLEYAKNIANPWIENQPDSGVFPYYFDENISWLDADVDFSISLLRIYELSGDNKYKIAADKCYSGLVKHNLPYSSINVKTKERVKNLNYGSIHDPDMYLADEKYLALFLKLPIYFSSDKRIYEVDGLFKLLRDR